MNENTQIHSLHNSKIPDDWEEIEFGVFAELIKSKYVPVTNKAQRCLELEHFDQGTGSINGWVNSFEQKSAKNSFKKGEVLFGKLRPYLQKYWLAEFDGVCSSEVWVLKSKDKKCSNEFLFRIVQSNRFIQVANVSSGSKMPRADWDYVSTFPFLLPPYPEQKRIAEVLTTWDEAINKTNQLIAQKELRKKWLMQLLLTGKKRLPAFAKASAGKKGFSGEWKETQLKNCFQFIKSYSISREGLSRDQGDLFCIHYGDIHAFYETEFLDFKTQPSIPRIIGDKICIQSKDYLIEGDIIMADASEDYEGVGEAIEVLNIDNKIAVGGLHTIVLRDFTGVTTANFRGYLFDSEKVRNELRKKATGTSVYSVTKTTLESLVLNLPSIKEQTAIARILQTADKEIQLLKTKSNKLKEQKKGLMQVLLTGKKRLKPSSS